MLWGTRLPWQRDVQTDRVNFFSLHLAFLDLKTGPTATDPDSKFWDFMPSLLWSAEKCYLLNVLPATGNCCWAESHGQDGENKQGRWGCLCNDKGQRGLYQYCNSYLFPDLTSPVALSKDFITHLAFSGWRGAWKETKMCEIKKESPQNYVQAVSRQ